MLIQIMMHYPKLSGLFFLIVILMKVSSFTNGKLIINKSHAGDKESLKKVPIPKIQHARLKREIENPICAHVSLLLKDC